MGKPGAGLVQFGQATLRPDEKLKLKVDFDRVRAGGAKQVGRYMLLIHMASPDGLLRGGVVCGRKFDNRAVARNRARRLVWESFRLVKAQVKTSHLIFIPRQAIKASQAQDTQRDMITLLEHAGLWTQAEKSD